jgi:hypothetical protein
MPTQSLMMNPMLATLSPDDQQSLLQLQQRQAIGQALLQQGLAPIDTSNRQVGGMGYRISPLEGLAKLANAYVGNKVSMDSMGKQAQLMGQMYHNGFYGDQQPPQAAPQAPVDAGGMTGDQSGQGVISSPIASPGAAPSGAQLGAAMGGGAPAPQVRMGNGVLSLPGYSPQQSMMLYGMLGQDAYGKMLAAQMAPTAATLAARQGGFDPMLANQKQFIHDTYNAPVSATGTLRDPYSLKPVAYSAPDIPGTRQLYDAAGNSAGVEPLTGAQAAMQGNAAAAAAGSAQYKPAQIYDDATHQMKFKNELEVTNPSSAASANLANGMPPTQDGTPNGAPMTPLQRSVMNAESLGNPNAVSAKGAVGSMQTMPATLKNPGFGVKPPQNNSPAELQRVGVDFLGAMQHRYGNDSDAVIAYNMGPAATDKWISSGRQWDQLPAETRNYVGKTLAQAQNFSGSAGGAPSGGYSAAPPIGAQSGAEANSRNLSDELSKKWTDLNTQNQQAQGVISNLQNIKTLAAKAAVGPQSDRLNYVNGLLSLAGSEKATDAVTANDLLNKYSNQITARLSAGGMGTDAARTILQSAYPNAHMTPQAINEAADNLQGASQMVQAKTRLLAPLRNAGDATSYTNTETKFDQNADPRIFQYANIHDPVQRQAFARQLMQQDPKILDKIKVLQGLGAF